MIKSISGLNRVIFILFISTGFMSVYYLGYTSGKASPPEGVSSLSLQEAQRNTNKYLNSNPRAYNGVVNALVIDIQQYNAMGEILKNSVETSGFRIYYGLDDNNHPVRIIVGFGPTGRDNLNYLVSTSANLSGLCPPVCDNPGGTLGQ
jgi:hypothetical protein